MSASVNLSELDDGLLSMSKVRKNCADKIDKSICLFNPFFVYWNFQVPLYVATKMAKIRKASLAVPSPDTYATAGLKWVGYEPRCTPYWVHSIMWWLIQMIPEPIMDSVRLRSCLNIRKRGQAKEARSKAEWSVLWLAVLHHLWTRNHGLQPFSSCSTVFQLTCWKIWTFEHHEPTLNFLDNLWRSFHPVGCSQIDWLVCGLMNAEICRRKVQLLMQCSYIWCLFLSVPNTMEAMTPMQTVDGCSFWSLRFCRTETEHAKQHSFHIQFIHKPWISPHWVGRRLLCWRWQCLCFGSNGIPLFFTKLIESLCLKFAIQSQPIAPRDLHLFGSLSLYPTLAIHQHLVHVEAARGRHCPCEWSIGIWTWRNSHFTWWCLHQVYVL